MYPVLLQIGSLTIYSLWALLAIGIFISLLFINKLSKYRFVKLSFLAENSLLIFFCGLICARLVFIIYNLQFFINDFSAAKLLNIFYIWDKGLSIWGAVLGIFLSLFILTRKTKEDFGAWSDIVGLSIMFTAIFINIGTFLDGRNYGNPTDLPWGITVESSQYAVPIHPVQLYSALYCALIAVVLYQCFNLKFFKQNGIIALCTVALYSLFRFVEEFMRGDEANLIFGIIREAQIYSLLGLIISIILLTRKYQNFKKATN
jgi:phosphatidylglycerol:prolipoprotein diacylglycerol transferase